LSNFVTTTANKGPRKVRKVRSSFKACQTLSQPWLIKARLD
jgi:hypothetical protein